MARVNKAFAQVPGKVRLSRKNRVTETLYVGNLAFNTTEDDLDDALASTLCKGFVLEEVTIPCVNGKSKYCLLNYHGLIQSINQQSWTSLTL